eukprot:55692-Eustigmatos_ZCMA.PRE.1
MRLTLVSAMIGLLNGSIPIAITLLAEAHNGFNMDQAQMWTSSDPATIALIVRTPIHQYKARIRQRTIHAEAPCRQIKTHRDNLCSCKAFILLTTPSN